MEFRPLNLELMMTCAETPTCTNCKLRVGCPTRKRFYDQDERATELRFQMAEILTSTIVNKDNAYKAYVFMRNKMLEETHLHKEFSYL